MAQLYYGLKRWQWALVALLGVANALQTLSEYGSMLELLAGIGLSTFGAALLARIIVGAFRYVTYIFWNRNHPTSAVKVNRERKFFNLFAVCLVLFAGAFALAVLSPSDVDPDNPYGQETLVVASAHAPNDSHHTMTEDALEYWEGNTSDEYADYPIEYEYEPTAEDPDIRIRWVTEIDSCGENDHENLAGCADLVTNDREVPETVVVRVETDHSRAETIATLKHELGHTLGLTHDDEPQEVMSISDSSRHSRVASSRSSSLIPGSTSSLDPSLTPIRYAVSSF